MGANQRLPTNTSDSDERFLAQIMFHWQFTHKIIMEIYLRVTDTRVFKRLYKGNAPPKPAARLRVASCLIR
jgi:hypothetical protein